MLAECVEAPVGCLFGSLRTISLFGNEAYIGFEREPIAEPSDFGTQIMVKLEFSHCAGLNAEGQAHQTRLFSSRKGKTVLVTLKRFLQPLQDAAIFVLSGTKRCC